MDGKYYNTWCNGYHGPTIGVGWTEDFKTFHQLENAFLPYNRNGVLFPGNVFQFTTNNFTHNCSSYSKDTSFRSE